MTVDKAKASTRVLLAAIACILILTAVFTYFDISQESGYIDTAVIKKANLDKNQRKSLNSFNKIDDFPVYIMQYYGDYGFSEYLKEGKQVSRYLEGQKDFNACSCVAALSNKGNKLFGRNFDYFYSPKMLLFTDPSDGYSSVSMVDLRHLGFETEKDIDNASPEDIQRLLDSPYLPLDGMNEYGLTIGEMTAIGTQTSIDPNKVTLGDLTAMRLVLDRAKTVDEAVVLLGKYNIDFPPAPPLHFMISDREGKSAVIEFIEGEMKVIPNENPWQVSTNFLIYESGDAQKRSCSRYSTAERVLKEKEGYMTKEELMKLLEDISQSSTQWSIVYDMDMGHIELAIGREYEDIKRFSLEMK